MQLPYSMGKVSLQVIIRVALSSIFSLMAIMYAPIVAADDYEHPGYTQDVKEERSQITSEVVIIPLEPLPEPPLLQSIFTDKMTKEFSREFRNRFGHTEFEQISFTSNRFVESADSGRLTPVDEYIEKQEAFGEYIAKELTEYHIDQYLKGNRNTRAVYQVKQALSNVEVKTKSGYKFKFKYKLSSDRLIFKLERPGEKLHHQIDVLSSGEQATLRLSYDYSREIVFGTDYAPIEEMTSLRAVKKLTPALSTSITGQSFQKDTELGRKQDRVLLGLTWSD